MDTITLQENKKIYFSSDNHLGLPGKVKSSKREKIFIKWLDTIKNDAQVIFLLGDLFDFWFEFKKVVPKGYTRLFGKLAELTDAGVKIYFFVGNHDAWMRNYFKKELGIDVFFEPKKFKINSKKFFIGHGDGLGPGDYGYKFLKLIFRNSFFKFLFSCIHPDISIRIGEYLSRKNSVISGKEIKFESNEKELLFNYCKKILKSDHYNYFVFGHRHLPLKINLGNNSQYYNCGDWFNHYSYLDFTNSELTLKYFNPKI